MVRKSEFIWNTIGSLFYSFFNVFVLMCCTRVNGTEIAGVFSICYATGCILNAIGDLGIRIYQVTDTNRKYTFNEYLVARIVSIVAMIIATVGFVLVGKYSNEKLYICLILIGIRVIDNLSETFQSELQLQKKLDIAGIDLLVRNVIEIAVFVIFDIITKNIYVSFGMMLLSSICMFVALDFRHVKKIVKIDLSNKIENVKSIIYECTPLGLSTLISMYVINAVKYAIDGINNNTMQTYFNVLYMPTFVINLVSILIMKPFLKPFGEYWNNKEYNKFIKIIFILIGLLLAATAVIELGCAILGIPILNMIFAIDLTEYKIELLILILSGFFYASSTIIFYALGTIRKQKGTIVVYAITAIIGYFLSNYLVTKYQILGATIASTVIMFTLLLGMSIMFIIGYNKAKKENNKK